MKNRMKRWPLITSFMLFIALCISAAYWAMQLFKAASATCRGAATSCPAHAET